MKVHVLNLLTLLYTVAVVAAIPRPKHGIKGSIYLPRQNGATSSTGLQDVVGHSDYLPYYDLPVIWYR